MGGICSSGGSGVKPNIEEEENEAEELTVGSYFGESTLIKGVPQPRTVRALGRTSLLVLSSEVLQRLCGEDVLKNASVNTPAESSEPKANIVDDDQIRRPANQKKRGSISAGSIEVKKDWVAPVYEHTPEENQRLNEYFAKTTLLSKLDGQRKDTLIGAFQKKEFANGVEIITQGAEGDFYYILDVGSADVFVSKDGAPAQKVLDYGPGGAFGELALMVTEKRQATVRATSECVCWALDRETFHRVMVVGGRQETVERDKLLGKVPSLSGLSGFDRFNLSESLETREFKDGQNIVEAGSTVRELFIVRQGRCEAFKP